MEIFNDDYPYYSSINQSYVKQCAELAYKLKSELKITNVLEIGCNDGYMLRNFKEIQHTGYEPCKGPFLKAGELGLNVFNDFFDEPTPIKYSLILAFNVLAHIPTPKFIIQNIKKSLGPFGTVVIEVQNLEELVKKQAFDQIYHEHYIYWEPATLTAAFKEVGLTCIKIERLESHCGSIRAYFRHSGRHQTPVISDNFVDSAILSQKVPKIKQNFLDKMAQYKREGKKVAAFGAPAKGNTFLNYCGANTEMIEFTVDETPAKQNKFLPGSRIPIFDKQKLIDEKPDICIILPWNFYEEIKLKIDDVNTWGMECISPIETTN